MRRALAIAAGAAWRSPSHGRGGPGPQRFRPPEQMGSEPVFPLVSRPPSFLALPRSSSTQASTVERHVAARRQRCTTGHRCPGPGLRRPRAEGGVQEREGDRGRLCGDRG
ncbi:unnamed protein product [Prorocentrum cordatum]|uniref:Secreted protein n=1 Tax=Prorocentrum cordatum TaxID=2364126 RepID=A0ABN9SF21_9DINO|nr:unnamed protein product [Polarella glacialis]